MCARMQEVMKKTDEALMALWCFNMKLYLRLHLKLQKKISV